MNQRDDLGDATPGDWLSVVEAAQDWGFPDCYGQHDDTCAGVPAPTAELDPHTAVSGVAILTGGLGTGGRTGVGAAAVVAEWATGTVQRVALSRAGSAYTGTVAPFLRGFEHPEPVVVGSDGALYVGDWQSGTIYRVALAG
jgi:glucose/arabinose dehydrogenase